jgi:hypothetical protein
LRERNAATQRAGEGMIVCPRCDFIHSGIPAMTTASQGRPNETRLMLPLGIAAVASLTFRIGPFD